MSGVRPNLAQLEEEFQDAISILFELYSKKTYMLWVHEEIEPLQNKLYNLLKSLHMRFITRDGLLDRYDENNRDKFELLFKIAQDVLDYGVPEAENFITGSKTFDFHKWSFDITKCEEVQKALSNLQSYSIPAKKLRL